MTGAADPVPMLIDCDPGVDDAIAILCASQLADLVGITTVHGNVDIDHTTRNALAVTQMAGLDVPVHRGAGQPLVGELRDARHVHGPTGLGTVDVPDITRSAASDDAAGFIIDASHAHAGLQLLAVGPLTNIAHALERDPSLPERLGGFTIMGGAASGGNVTPSAEFNIWADPEAADRVITGMGPMTMVGLDVTHQVLLGTRERDELAATRTRVTDLAAELLDHAIARAETRLGEPAAPIHDACAVAAVTHPHLFGGGGRTVTIELAGAHTRGMTVVDDRPGPGAGGPVDVLRHVDAEAVIRLIVDATTTLGAL